jgi:hypothetical protein
VAGDFSAIVAYTTSQPAFDPLPIGIRLWLHQALPEKFDESHRSNPSQHVESASPFLEDPHSDSFSPDTALDCVTATMCRKLVWRRVGDKLTERLPDPGSYAPRETGWSMDEFLDSNVQNLGRHHAA